MMPEAPQETGISQAPTMQQPKRWPLVNTVDSRDGDFLKDARLVNAFGEKDKAIGQYQVEKRPGFAPTPVITGSGIGQGINRNSVFSAGNPFNVHGTGIPAVNPSSLIFINDIVSNVFYETIYQNGVIIVPRHSLGPVSINLALGSSPTRANFLNIEGASIGGVGAGTSVTLFGGGASNWVWTTSPLNGALQAQGGPLAYIYQGIPPPGGSTISVLTPLLALGTTAAVGGVAYYGYPLSTVPGFVVLNGFCYVMDTAGVIYQTTIQNDPSGWNGLQVITAASDSDIGIQLARQLIYIVAIKSFTTQFFYDAGNQVGSSLSPLPGAIYNIGCLSADTFAELDGVLFWVSQSREGTYSVVMVKDLSLTTISDPSIEKFLEIQPGAIWQSLAFQHVGHKFLILTNVSRNKTVVYDIGEKLWYLWTDFLGNFYPIGSRAVSPTGDEWHQEISTGSVYKMAADYVYPNDHGNLFPVDIYTPNFDDGVDRIKVLSAMRFNTDQVNGSVLQIRSSDDDYATWNNFRTVDLSCARPFINDEGSFYRRAYNFRHFSNTKFRIRSADLQLDRGVF